MEWRIGQIVPPSVIVNENRDVLYFQGNTVKYLRPPEGNATLSIYSIGRDGLLYANTSEE